MKIGIEAQRIFRKKKHGMDIVAVELIRNLQKIDLENEYVIFVKDDVDSATITESKNFRIVKIKGGPYPYWEQVLLPKAVKENGVQLLHCTSNTAPINLDIPLVITLHDIIYLEQWNFTKGSLYQRAGNLYRRWNVPPVVKKSSALITVSEFERKRIKEYFNLEDDRIITVYNGVGQHFKMIDDPAILTAIKNKYSLPDKYVFYLGNTDPKKNMEGVMRAMSYLRKKNKLNFQLLMLDIDRSFLSRMAAKIGDPEILPYISFSGYVPNAELPAVYSMAQTFLYPSLRESFGIPILEAMACGVPVITSITSSMPEVAGNAAIFANPLKPEEIGDKIADLLANQNLQQEMIQKGLSRSAEFSWSKNAFETLRIYKQVLQIPF